MTNEKTVYILKGIRERVDEDSGHPSGMAREREQVEALTFPGVTTTSERP